MKLNLLKEKKILILGLGREGESSFKFLRKQFPKKTIGVADQLNFNRLPDNIKKLIKKDKNTRFHLGKNYLKALKDYEIIIKTPGVPLKILAPYLSKNQIITTQTDIFLEQYAKQTIGITGTKGKSTTSSLIYQILKKAKKSVELIGNIGRPPLNFFGKKRDFFVFEMSCHQLQGLKISPKIAVFLNIYRDHLDYYRNFQEYFSARKNITYWQKEGDVFVFNYEMKKLRNLAKKTKALKIPFGVKNKKGCYLKNNWIYYEGKKIIPPEVIPLKGRHNLFNVMASVAVASLLGIKPKIIEKAIKEFKPLEHRLEFVGEFGGVKYYNDSIATIPEATIEAIKALSDVETLILGGFERKQNFKNLLHFILKKKIKNLILLPETGKRIYKELQNIKKKWEPNCFLANNMKEVIEIAKKVTKKGICLLSPASASFGLFKDYRDRGEQFKKYLYEISKK
ncbi:MAG: UDP-N-acetylmuramoyl-L-alanine--D-glutamate ligase [Candidatus Pacebacteria bacterium]|nr:UDP-N-acetylmuramoyl-L-alanine--D-glutamate ligase [Candidatus Paceibacterota bacterium]